ncbi:MAG: YfhO family protein [Candidatus Levyibacteriota bacterium]
MKKLCLRFWPLIFIFVIWFIFANPYFLQGRAPFAASYQLNNFAPWSAYPQFAGPVKNGAMPDVITQIYPWRHLAIEIWKSGQVPLWNPYSFAGTPLLANYQSAVLSPLNLLFFIFPFVDGWSILILLQPLLAGLSMYVFVRALKRSEIASLISSISFMFCGFMTSWMGYGTLGYAILPLPLTLFAVEKYFNTKKIRFLTLLSFTILLSFFSGHFQISIYFLLFAIVYILYKLIVTKDSSSFLKTSLFVGFGLLLVMPQLLPSTEFYLQSFRSSNFQKAEVIPLSYLPTLFAPDFFGNPVTRNDWFGHYAEWNGFIGVIPLILALYAITVKKKKEMLFFLVAGTAALLFALDTKLADLLVWVKVPVISTSAASRIVVVYSFMFAVLSAFGFDGLIRDLKDKKIKKIAIFFSILAALIALMWAAVYLEFHIPALKAVIAKNNLKLPTLVFFSGVGIVLLSALNKKFIYACGLLLLVLVSLDMLRFVSKWQEFSPKNLVFADLPVASAFSQISSPNRIMSNFGGEASIYFRLPSLEGYDALYIKRYGEFAASIADGKLRQSSRSVVMFPKDSPNTSAMMDLLGTKYVVHKNSDDGAGWTFPVWTYPGGQFAQIYQERAYKIYENRDVSPRAFLVGDYVVEEDPQKIITHLVSENIDLRKQIILEENPEILKSLESVGLAEIKKYKPNEIDIEVSSARPGLLFLSDNYYRGWKAEIDGKNVPILRANYTFRAVPVTSGKHLVKFRYQPQSFTIGLWLALGGALGIVVISLFPKFLARKI